MQEQNKLQALSLLIEELEKRENNKRDSLSSSGRLTARQRISSLFDEASFVETNAFLGRLNGDLSDSDRVVTGYGAIDGRLVFAFAQDFSSDKAAFCEAQAKKICALYDLAEQNGAPVVAVLDSNGADLNEDISVLANYGKIIKKSGDLKGIVPQIAVVCGVCSGAASIFASACDFIVVEKNNGRLFVNPPSVIANINKDRKDFASASDLSALGIAALSGSSDAEVLGLTKKLLSFLPSNNEAGCIDYASHDDVNRAATCFNAEGYTAATVLKDLADSGDVFELFAEFAPEIKCGFITLGGSVCGFLANDILTNEGKLTKNACKKASNFVSLCNLFDINILNVIDTPGFDTNDEADSAIADSASDLALAFAMCDSPVVSLITGKAYGSAFVALGSKAIGANVVFALPYAQINTLKPETAVSFLWNEKLKDEADPLAGRAKLFSLWRDDASSPVKAANAGLIDDVILPTEARQRIISAFYMLKK